MACRLTMFNMSQQLKKDEAAAAAKADRDGNMQSQSQEMQAASGPRSLPVLLPRPAEAVAQALMQLHHQPVEQSQQPYSGQALVQDPARYTYQPSVPVSGPAGMGWTHADHAAFQAAHQAYQANPNGLPQFASAEAATAHYWSSVTRHMHESRQAAHGSLTLRSYAEAPMFAAPAVPQLQTNQPFAQSYAAVESPISPHHQASAPIAHYNGSAATSSTLPVQIPHFVPAGAAAVETQTTPTNGNGDEVRRDSGNRMSIYKFMN